MTLDASQSRLYVAQDNADQVAVIDTATNQVIAKIDAARRRPAMLPHDRGTALHRRGDVRGDALARRRHAVRGEQRRELDRGDPADGPRRATQVSGLIPTAYEPHDITFSADGSWMYIINGKSVTGPNPGHLAGSTASITSITYPGGNAAAAAAAQGLEPVPVPAGAGVAGQRAGAEPRRAASDLTERVAREQLLRDRDRRERRAGDAASCASASST